MNNEVTNWIINTIGVNDAAIILNVSPGHVKNLCAAGKIVAKKIGKTWVIDRSRLKGVMTNA
ncbi:helix-turn-helix domain-containing protein [Bacillus cereus]|uniref:helix-turn-helix domain-containing protein n=1 Tax=Bacillus wiedmannii TaxID=1890302 RepID=UPI0015CF5933|nr:helix-turn-helix domain-containing protein [Bacillus wiedmannii]MDA1915013.1 helix-turn-helix domain-containing protein [Bacillus cereus]